MRWRDNLGLVLVVLLAPDSIAAGSAGARVAARQLSFVRTISARGLRLSSDFSDVANKAENAYCKLRTADLAGLPEDRVRLARQYAREYCSPWMRFWDRALAPCDKDAPPAWCDDEAELLRRIDLQGYFEKLATGLECATTPLERDNIIYTVTTTLHAHVITEFPKESVDGWTVAAVVPYLAHASSEQAISLATELKATWYGLTPAVLHAFEDYISTEGSLDEDRRDSLRRTLISDLHT